MLRFNDIEIEKKGDFYKKIEEYYLVKNQNKFPGEYIEMLCVELTHYYYDQYVDFRKTYPKSIKRYSKFEIKDLEHPFTHDLLINFSTRNLGEKHNDFCSHILEMEKKDFVKYEINRKAFKGMF